MIQNTGNQKSEALLNARDDSLGNGGSDFWTFGCVVTIRNIFHFSFSFFYIFNFDQVDL